MLIGMAGPAVGGRMFDSLGVSRVFNLQVTFEAVYFVVRHMLLVEKLVIINPFQVVLPIVTNDASFPRHVPVSPN
jgi:hypothetical protein